LSLSYKIVQTTAQESTLKWYFGCCYSYWHGCFDI